MATNLIFPLDPNKVAWTTSISQKWEVAEQKTASGRRRTLCQQTLPGWTINVTFPMITRAERDILLGFYAQCKGKWQSFWFMDAEHNHAEKVELVSPTGDNHFQLMANVSGFYEPVEKVTNLHVFLNNEEIPDSQYILRGGELIVTSNREKRASYDYYWKVCFADTLTISQKFEDYYSVSLKLEVVRE